MARKLRNADLETRSARGRLPARGKPYWMRLDEGLHLGYRRLRGGSGPWLVRRYVGGKYVVKKMATADDFSDTNGADVLTFDQAQARAREFRDQAANGKHRPLTVADAVSDYFVFLEAKGKSTFDARYRANAFILPRFGNVEINTLEASQLRSWLTGLAKAPPRLRTKKGAKQKHREIATDDETVRRRRSTANRTLTVLKAALNLAWKEKRKQVPSNTEWSCVEPFENVDAARARYLKIPEVRRLVNACDPDFRDLVQAALQTGARYGELTRLTVADFNSDSGTIAITRSKSGKARDIVLTEEGVSFFEQLCAGRASSELIFRSRNGGPWKKSHQRRPMMEACARAKIIPPIGFHGLRHTWASLSVMARVPLLIVARNLGHSDTRMVEKHYGHLEPTYAAEAIRAGAPRFGMVSKTNVRTIVPR
jgi:integrase